MSPEQAKGRAVDKRSDVWAFGCVFFEMLTGRRAFEGEDVTDTIAAVVRGEPDWSALPADVPEQIRLLLKRCLEKDRKARISDVGVARFLMTETMPTPAQAVSAAVVAAPPRSRRRVIIVSSGLIVAATVLLSVPGLAGSTTLPAGVVLPPHLPTVAPAPPPPLSLLFFSPDFDIATAASSPLFSGLAPTTSNPCWSCGR